MTSNEYCKIVHSIENFGQEQILNFFLCDTLSCYIYLNRDESRAWRYSVLLKNIHLNYPFLISVKKRIRYSLHDIVLYSPPPIIGCTKKVNAIDSVIEFSSIELKNRQSLILIPLTELVGKLNRLDMILHAAIFLLFGRAGENC